MERKKLFVFDLDFTLWNTGGTWCDCTYPPYKKIGGKILDSRGDQMQLFPDTIPILEAITQAGIEMAIASRTERPDWARQLLILFEIDQFFKYQEIYPTVKTKHLNKIHTDSGIPFSYMVFFDDEYRNIEDAQSMGVESVFVKNGINIEMVKAFL